MTHRILIIEDTPTIARVQKHIAQKAGYEVDIAQSLAETKELISKHAYFCAVVDFILPDAPQGEAVPCTVAADIPTIVMTGNIDNQTRDTVEKYPIIDYIIKGNKQAYEYLEKQLYRLPRNKQVKVLVVDDSASTRQYICNLLTRHKYQIFQAADGLEALKELENTPDISVIITDKEMPNMGGIELCNEIRRIYSNDEKAVIGISGATSSNLSALFLKNGANDYLYKPFNSEEFYCRLSQNVDMLEHIETIKRQANTDYLTKLPNRRYFFEEANKSLKQFKKAKMPAQLAMLDIDHFKAINDTYGWILHRRGNSAEALSYLENAAEGLPEDAIVQYHLGKVLVALDRPQDALNQFRKTVEIAGPEATLPQVEDARALVESLSTATEAGN